MLVEYVPRDTTFERAWAKATRSLIKDKYLKKKAYDSCNPVDFNYDLNMQL